MEIERKFILKELPNVIPIKNIDIYQGYISINPEVRVRSYEVLQGKDKGHKDFKLTIKGDGGLVREEIETYISEEFFILVKGFIKKPFIHKDYYKYIVDGKVLECSIVDLGERSGFIYGEVEFDSIEEAMKYNWPFPGAIDVTNDKSFKMKTYWERTRL